VAGSIEQCIRIGKIQEDATCVIMAGVIVQSIGSRIVQRDPIVIGIAIVLN
jgi:hypothetical protein